MPTLYDILDVVQDASHLDIKKAYHRIMLKYHPDKNPDIPENEKTKYEAITKKANSAWETLGDPRKRIEYDKAELHPAKRQKRDHDSPEYDSDQHFSQPPPPPTPPRKYPTFLDIQSHGWNMTIELSGDYEPYEWGPGSVFYEEGRIFIYMKIRTSEWPNIENRPHISIEINSTPGMQRIHKIESLYKHRMQPEGTDQQVLLTVFLEPGSGKKFHKMRQYNAEEMNFKFRWNVHVDPESGSLLKPPAEAITHATCLHFFTRTPRQRAMFVPKSEHPDNPRSVLLKDSDLKPNNTLNFVGTSGQERSWITLKRVTHGGTKMYQIATCAWQDFGQGKGEQERAAEDAYR